MNKLSENKLEFIEIKKNGFQTLDQLDLPNGFVCDFETGICGPADQMVNNEKQIVNIEEQ